MSRFPAIRECRRFHVLARAYSSISVKLNSELTDERKRERKREREREREREGERRREKKKAIWEVRAAIDPTLPFVALTLALVEDVFVDERWTLSMSLRCCVTPTYETGRVLSPSRPLFRWAKQPGISGKWVVGLARRVRFAETGRASTASIALGRGDSDAADLVGVKIRMVSAGRDLFLSLSLSLSLSLMSTRAPGMAEEIAVKGRLSARVVARCCRVARMMTAAGRRNSNVIQPASSGRRVS